LVDDAHVGAVEDLHRLGEPQRHRLLALVDTAVVDAGRRAEERGVGQRRAGARAEQAEREQRAEQRATERGHAVPPWTPESSTVSRAEPSGSATRRRRKPTAP